MPDSKASAKADPPNKPKVEAEQFRKIFVGGLTYSTTEDMLRDYYSQWGQVVDVIIMRDQQTRRSRGFGFVTYARAFMVDECMSNRPHMIDGKSVEPKRAVPKEEASVRPEAGMSVKKLYVSGIKDDHTSDMLRDYFKDFGDIIDVEIMTDKNSGKKRGFAFVSFDDYDAVDKAVLQKSHFIGGKRCDVKKALSKEEMKKLEQAERDKQARSAQTRDVAPAEEAVPARQGTSPWPQAQAAWGSPVRSYGGLAGSTYGSAYGSQVAYGSGPSPWQGPSTPGMQAAMNKAYYQQQQAMQGSAYGWAGQQTQAWSQGQTGESWPSGAASSSSASTSWSSSAQYGSSSMINMRPWT